MSEDNTFEPHGIVVYPAASLSASFGKLGPVAWEELPKSTTKHVPSLVFAYSDVKEGCLDKYQVDYEGAHFSKTAALVTIKFGSSTIGADTLTCHTCPCFIRKFKILAIDLGDKETVNKLLNGHDCRNCNVCDHARAAQELSPGPKSLSLRYMPMTQSELNAKLPTYRVPPKMSNDKTFIGNSKHLSKYMVLHLDDFSLGQLPAGRRQVELERRAKEHVCDGSALPSTGNRGDVDKTSLISTQSKLVETHTQRELRKKRELKKLQIDMKI